MISSIFYITVLKKMTILLCWMLIFVTLISYKCYIQILKF
jgi:hypothetical protein